MSTATAQATNKFVRQAEENLDREQCRRNAHHFIFGDHCGKFLVTKDEHDTENSVKQIKDDPYLRVMLDCLLVSGRLIKPEDAGYYKLHGGDDGFLTYLYDAQICFVEKSRHVFATWLVLLFEFWRAKFRENQLIIVQSKREDDAANLVFNKEPHIGRMSFVEMNLPQHLRSLRFPGAGAYGHLYFPNGSHVWAIPEGADIIRSNNPSSVFSDEAAFQPEFGNAYTAAVPATKGGGQIVPVSSANPGSFQELVEST